MFVLHFLFALAYYMSNSFLHFKRKRPHSIRQWLQSVRFHILLLRVYLVGLKCHVISL